MFLNFGIDEQGRYLGHTGGVSMFDTFNRFWRELADEGVITDSEYATPTSRRSIARWRNSSPPCAIRRAPAYRGGLRLEHVELRHRLCPYAADFEQARGPGELCPRITFRRCGPGASRPLPAACRRARPAEQRAAILDEFYGATGDSVAAARRSRHGLHPHRHIVCRKSESMSGERDPRRSSRCARRTWSCGWRGSAARTRRG